MRATLTRLAVAGSVLVVAGCGGSAAPQDGAAEFPPPGARPATDATFRLAISSDPGALDFAVNQQSTAQQVMAFAYDGLVTSIGGNEIVAELASKWRLTTKKLVFTIRDGVTCSDGTAVTPSVIAENFAFYKSPEVQFPVFGDLAD